LIRWDSATELRRAASGEREPSFDLAANSSIKTVGIHVSHIRHKLDIPTRVEAAAIAHRIASD
jgi:DNA-binding CsgD family transcriptional regulator